MTLHPKNKFLFLVYLFSVITLTSIFLYSKYSLGQEARVIFDFGFTITLISVSITALFYPLFLKENQFRKILTSNLLAVYLQLIVLTLNIFVLLSIKGSSFFDVPTVFYFWPFTLSLFGSLLVFIVKKRRPLIIWLTTTFFLFLGVVTFQAVNSPTNNFVAKSLADAYWYKSISYFAEERDSYDKLGEYLKITTTYDPSFEGAYVFGLINLPNEALVNKSLVLGKKGVANMPTSWRIPYYLGNNYYAFKGDKEMAKTYYDMTLANPNTPENVVNVIKALNI